MESESLPLAKSDGGTEYWNRRRADRVRHSKVPVMREMALKIVLGLVGVVFLAASYPMVLFIKEEPALAMMLSLYVALGIFLLLAIRDPWGSRSVIAFAAWSSFAHAALMGTQAACHMIASGEMLGVWGLLAIGVLLVALRPRNPLLAARQA